MRGVRLAGIAATLITLTASAGAAESLAEAVRAAVATNPAIEATEAESAATAFDLLALEREYAPTVRVFGEAGIERIDDPANLSASDNDRSKFARQLGVEAELLLFDGYRRANMVYAAAAALDGSILELLDASETMALNATEAYIDVARHRALAQVAQRSIRRHAVLLRQVRDLVEGGRLPISDRLTAQDRLNAAQLAGIEVEQALADAVARYTRVVGKPPQGPMHVPRPRVPDSLEAVLNAAMANSFRIRSAEAEVERARFTGEVIEAEARPRVTLNAGLAAGRDLGGSLGRERDAFVGLRLNWTLYQGGRKAERNAQAARTQKALAERALAARQVRELATQTWNSYVGNAERARQLQMQLNVNTLLVRQFTEEFEAAKRSLLDVLETERARFNTEFQAISADASLAFSGYRLLAAQSRLADHFGVARRGIVLDPGYRHQVRARPASAFDLTIEKLR